MMRAAGAGISVVEGPIKWKETRPSSSVISVHGRGMRSLQSPVQFADLMFSDCWWSQLIQVFEHSTTWCRSSRRTSVDLNDCKRFIASKLLEWADIHTTEQLMGGSKRQNMTGALINVNVTDLCQPLNDAFNALLVSPGDIEIDESLRHYQGYGAHVVEEARKPQSPGVLLHDAAVKYD